MKFNTYPDQEMMCIDLANILAGELNEAVMGHGEATFVVPGGTTPGPVFDILSAADLDWARVRVLLSDERWVPESAPRSNTRLIRERLLVGRAAKAQFIPLCADTPAPEAALPMLSAGVAAVLPISVLLLGMGEDMHIASLFPGADRLREALDADAPPLLAMRAPGVPEPRVTLTAPVLQGAISTHVMITGEAKRQVIEAAARPGPIDEAPIRVVLDEAEVHWAA